jgi:glycosyltransferase involved in cell wall biosynthesis
MIVSVVVPMFRTAPMLDELHRRIRESIESDATSLEILLVDDACDEGSGDAAAALAASSTAVRLLTHTTNQGQHRAIRTGLSEATGEIVVILDADLQDPPEAIPVLTAELDLTDSHAVFAGRRGRYQRSGRTLTGRAFKRALAAIAGTPIDGGGFVALSRAGADATLLTSFDDFYLLTAIAAGGVRMSSIPIERGVRREGKSAMSSRARISLARRGLTMAWQIRRAQASES